MTAVFTFPAMTIGFLFVGVPLLVHLINMLRHRRQRWAAMDFLLASYRKQKKWIILRQLLLLLARVAVAALLIALLAGWTGGRQLLGALGGETTHHVIVLDDSYSMGDRSGGETSYRRALRAVQELTQRLAAEDGNHQLTVLRASRAALAVRGGSESGDAVADLAAQTILADASLIGRVMATEASPLRTDLIPAIDMASGLIESSPADRTTLYLISDFRRGDWDSPDRVGESLRSADAAGASVRMIDCASDPGVNLAVTEVSPNPDVWVAGVPVVLRVTVTNHGPAPVNNVPVNVRVIRYGEEVRSADPTRSVSGEVESQPAVLIESLASGEEVTKTFQVFIAEPATHAVEVSLPEDVLPIDNRRSCVLPLTESERVLVIDEDPEGVGAYHITSVLDPGSQVRVGAIPETQPPSFLRSITPEQLAKYRAVYLVDLETIGEGAAESLSEYVRDGGGLCWFLGSRVNRQAYNSTLRRGTRRLLPAELAAPSDQSRSDESGPGDVRLGEKSPLLAPIREMGDAVFGLVRVSRSWTLSSNEEGEEVDVDVDIEGDGADGDADTDGGEEPRVVETLRRRDGVPLVTEHDVGRGRVVTVLTGLDGEWTNWAGDPSFVVFLLQTNATLWSAAAPSTRRYVDEPLERYLPIRRYAGTGSWLPPADDPPRIPLDFTAGDGIAVPNAGAASGDASGDDVAAAGGSDSPGNDATRAGPAGSGSEGSDSEGADSGTGSAAGQVSLSPIEQLLAGGEIADLLRPGISEWSLTRDDGSVEIVPEATVIRPGEGDLRRADPAEIRRGLEPIEVRFVSSAAWSEENRGAGGSTLALVMLGLLAGLLGAEQWLAHWASYHTAGSKAGGGR